MRKNHVVRKQGYFKVEVAAVLASLGHTRYFHSFDNAFHFFRYCVSFLGWNYGILQFVYNDDKPSHVLFFVNREA